MALVKGGDESKVANIDSQKRDASSFEPMRGLEHRPIATTDQSKVGLMGFQVIRSANSASAITQRIHPFMGDPFLFQNLPQLERHCFGVILDAVDDNENLFDFHFNCPGTGGKG